MKAVDMLPSRYRIEGKLGEGGFGEVFKVYDSQLKLTLALKILPDKTTSIQNTLTKEFETLSRLQHPHLVRVFEYGLIPPHNPFFTMELLEGKNLRSFLGNRADVGNLPIVIRQTLDALIYLNGKKILHGDIKPENIMITLGDNGSMLTKLLDFGLISSPGEKKHSPSGTGRYIAPEIILHGNAKSPATDLYALGISLIEAILAIDIPIASDIDEAFFESTYRKLNQALTDAHIRNPSALSSFLLDLCRPDPDNRMQDAREARESLEMIAPEISLRPSVIINNVFVDRTKELKEIDNLLIDASNKKVIVLSGHQGIGKKSILWKAAQSAQLRHFLPLNLTPSSSYFSLDQITETLGAHLSTDEKQHLLSKLPAWAKPTAGRERRNLDSDRAIVIYAHIIEFLIELSASRRILVMVSDIERSSEDFLLFIIQLLKQLEISDSHIRLIITLNSRLQQNDAVSEALNRLTGSPLATMIAIQPFDDELLKHFLTACFGQILLPDKERQDIISKTQGIPLVIAAFINSLIAANVIQHRDGHWILDRKLYNKTPIPTSLDNSLAAAFRDLEEDHIQLLRVVALIGPANGAVLAKIASGIVADTKSTLSNLMGNSMLAHHGDNAVFFTHPLYAQHICESMPPDTMRELSGRLADSLVASESKDALRIAQLYSSAERVDEAIKYGLDAVDRMYSSYLLYDCFKLLDDLRELALEKGNKPQLLAVLDRLAPIEHKTGLPKEAIRDYGILIDSPELHNQRANYYIQLADVYSHSLGNVEESWTTLQKALEAAEEAHQSHLVAIAQYNLAALNPKSSIPHYEKAAALSKNTNPNLYITSLAHLAYYYLRSGKRQKAAATRRAILKEIQGADLSAQDQVYYFLYWYEFMTANYRTARSYLRKRMQIEKKIENSLELITSMSDLGGCYYTEGSFYRMIDTLKEAHEIALKYSKYVSAITILSNLALGYRTIADYGLSLRMILQAESLGQKETFQAWNSAFLSKPTMLYMMLGKAKEIDFQDSAGRLLERARQTNNHIGLGHHSLAFGLHHLYNLEPDEALPHAKKALAYFRKASDRDDVVHALINLAMIQVARGKPKLAAPHLREAEEIYDAIHCEYLRPLLMLGKGMLARHEHSHDAKKILADALKVSKKMSTRETTWQIQRELALYHKDQDEPHKALAYYRDAVETIKQITETIDDEELKLSYLQVPFRRRVFTEIKSLA